MITAIDDNGIKVFAFKESKDRCYYCPACKTKMVLKKGMIKVHHFAHVPDCDCEFRYGESEIHERIKVNLYHALNEKLPYGLINNVDIEHRINDFRTDIYAAINGIQLAFEIQCSNISDNEIEDRMEKHSNAGLATLWICDDITTLTHGQLGQYTLVYKPKSWQKKIYSIYKNNLFIYSKLRSIMAYHFEPYMLSHEGGEYFDSYNYESKTMFNAKKRLFNFVFNFHQIKNIYSLWMPELERWWESEYI